jgi:CPA2 family monovalent cation:H+ antiporter-2
MHELPLLVNIAVALGYALIGGALAKRARLPPLVGYLLAGVIIGPFTPGFIGNQASIGELAELGVLFLMFGVGLHFSFNDLWQVRNIAIPGALIQMSIASALGYALTRSWGWNPGASLILGVAISVASTVVLLRALMDHALLDSVHGRVAVGWLVLEDLATVAILVLLPLAVADGSGGGARIAAIAIGKAVIFLVLMLVAGKRLIPLLLRRIVWLQSRELFILAALTIAIGTALLSAAWFGVSLALGAFVAGVVVSESPYSHQVAADLLPFREAFAVLFFVSVGMLVDPVYLAEHWKEVLALSALIIVGKATIAACAGFAFPYPARTALVVAAGLSQVGEFSFIVGQAGVSLGLLDRAQYSLILAGALISITLNPFMFHLIAPTERWLSQRTIWRWLNRHGPTPGPRPHMHDHVVIVGWGRVGRHVADVLGTLGIDRLVIEADSAAAEALTSLKVPTLFGDAANSEILTHADLDSARALVVTLPDESAAAITVAAARNRAPSLHIIARAATREGARHLSDLGADEIVRPEFEGGLQVLRRTLLMLGYPVRRIQEYTDAIRREEVAPAVGEEGSRLLERLAISDLDLAWISIPESSGLANLSLEEANLRPRAGVSVVAISHDGVITSTPSPKAILRAGDDVALVGNPAQIDAARAVIAGH